jgi:lycopene cyclase domain-containing protein
MIPEKYTYLFVNTFTLLFPFIFSWTKKFDFKVYWKEFFTVNLCIAAIYILWDVLYTHLGVWGFDTKYTIGFQILNLPIEETLFFLCIPYACVFTYYCFRKYVFDRIKIRMDFMWLVSSISFFIFGIYHYEKLYTSAAFISSGLTCLIAYRMKQISFFHFLIFYLIILIPFFICNGILTGSFLHRVVVFYNDNENLGIRLLTIPFEDIFYGLGLLMLNIMGFEYFLKKGKINRIRYINRN